MRRSWVSRSSYRRWRVFVYMSSVWRALGGLLTSAMRRRWPSPSCSRRQACFCHEDVVRSGEDAGVSPFYAFFTKASRSEGNNGSRRVLDSDGNGLVHGYVVIGLSLFIVYGYGKRCIGTCGVRGKCCSRGLCGVHVVCVCVESSMTPTVVTSSVGSPRFCVSQACQCSELVLVRESTRLLALHLVQGRIAAELGLHHQ
ncbi:hypothetical protein Taro_047404 [Colocasia esculenta]|uniref:Uncharacterized protein n=1 Tax=Colocasia esculenta TaxID=4460 RepID=A0A843X737_COLES|nr:hypothetical protein [Colocasia esculenta]